MPGGAINPLDTRSPTESTTPDERFLRRWSPRALAGAPVSEATLMTLFEAARWAPSCFNAQPWRFSYVLRDSPAWAVALDTLVEANQAWARQAGALIAVISRTRYEHNDKEADTHSFDAGAAWMSLALQADAMGLATHGMRGFDMAAARAAWKVPEVYQLPALIAVGYPGAVEDLPDTYRDREVPSPRKALTEIVFADNFGALEA